MFRCRVKREDKKEKVGRKERGEREIGTQLGCSYLWDTNRGLMREIQYSMCWPKYVHAHIPGRIPCIKSTGDYQRRQ